MSLKARLLFLLFALGSAAVFVRLGFWQLSRLNERRARNAAAQAARALPVVELNRDRNPGDSGGAGRRVEVRGVYDGANEIVLREQSFEGTPGVRVVTPLRPSIGDTAVLVLRGFVPAPDARRAPLDSLSEPGERLVAGLALPLESATDGGAPLDQDGHSSWRRLDLAALRQRLPYPIYGFYLLQTPDSSLPRFPRRLDAPVLDDGPHLNYAIQWFAFALIATVAGVVVVKRSEK